MANVRWAMIMVEESQERERRAIEELEIVRKQLDKERRYRETSQQLVVRDEKVDESAEMIRYLQNENKKIQEANKVIKLSNSKLRNEILRIGSVLTVNQDRYEMKLMQLEEAIRELVRNTQNAIETDPNQPTNECKFCRSRDVEIANLRTLISSPDIAKLKTLTVLDQVNECCSELKGIYEIMAEKQKSVEDSRTLEKEGLESDDEFEYPEDYEALQERLDDALQILDEPATDLSQSESTQNASFRNLKLLVNAERKAHAASRRMMDQVRDQCMASILTIEDSFHQYIESKSKMKIDEDEYLRGILIIIEEERNCIDDIVRLMESNVSPEYVVERIEELQSLTQQAVTLNREFASLKASENMPDDASNKMMENLESVNQSLEREQQWLVEERDAIRQSVSTQQLCVKKQLRVLEALRTEMAAARDEKTRFLEDQAMLFHTIRQSIGAEVGVEKSLRYS